MGGELGGYCGCRCRRRRALKELRRLRVANDEEDEERSGGEDGAADPPVERGLVVADVRRVVIAAAVVVGKSVVVHIGCKHVPAAPARDPEAMRRRASEFGKSRGGERWCCG